MAVIKLRKLVRIKPEPPKTLVDVIGRLEADTKLLSTRRRDLLSACNSLARLAHRTASDIPADVKALRDLLEGLHPVQARVSSKRLSNIKSELSAALIHTGAAPAPDPDIEPSPAWAEFLSKATEKHQAWMLSRFARFCTNRNFNPSDVDDGIVDRFRAQLDEQVLTNKPAKIIKSTTTSFNAIVKRNGLNMPLLNASTGPSYVTRPMEGYSQSLQQDIDAYIRRLEKPDLFSEDGPVKALSPITLRNIRANLRQTLNAAVLAGHDPDRFDTLKDLLNVEVLTAAFDHMTDRLGGRMPTALNNIIATLLAIARYHVASPPEIIRKLEKAQHHIAQKLDINDPKMSPKNALRLEQFDDERNIALLINLPTRLIKHANLNPAAKQNSIDAMCAAAIAILQACPMRMKNLASLRIGEEIKPVPDGKRTKYLIHLNAGSVKNNEQITAVIKHPLASVVTAYIQRHRKHNTEAPGDWLFPKVSGGPRSPGHLGGTIQAKVFAETGLVAHPHLFRHIAAKLLLEAHPGAYETARRLLGHKKLETTTKVYAPLSNKAAHSLFQGVLSKHREDRA